MVPATQQQITLNIHIPKPVPTVWTLWTLPEHIMNWNAASSDWHCPFAENDLRPGGRFLFRMAARNGSESFDWTGTYREVIEHTRLAYRMDDGRLASVNFTSDGDGTAIEETFEPETTNTIDQQRFGWQAILNNFRAYAEKQG